MNKKERLQLTGTAIFATGLLAAFYIFATRPPDKQVDLYGYDITKKQLNDLQRFGGQTSVTTYQLTTWFNSLWHGRQLGYTLIVISFASALICFLMSRWIIDKSSDNESVRAEE